MLPPTIVKFLPYISLILGIFALGMTAIFIRWANAPATITGFYRLSITSTILLPFFIWKNSKNKSVTRSNLIFPILGGVFTAFDFAFWNTAVLFTTASNATLLGNTAPIWVALVTILIFGKRFPREFWIGLLLALGGAALVLGNDFLLHPRLGLGDLLAVLAGIFYAAYLLCTQFGRKTMDPLSYMTIMVFSASIITFFINLFLGLSFIGYSGQSWLVFLLLALVSQILGYMSISYALGHLPASVVAPSMVGQPILTTLLAIPLLGEFPQPVQILGGCIALAGIYLIHNSHSREVNQSIT